MRMSAHGFAQREEKHFVYTHTPHFSFLLLVDFIESAIGKKLVRLVCTFSIPVPPHVFYGEGSSLQLLFG